ncbi:cation diffusion facilitator family transporter [Mesobacillus campisalis]|uniref:Cation diffusion facilitator family transporter n=1 Tax=Mesobacillus campisalis TaxID=1408103 RepID=A0A0M2SRC4_9BACI|nr:cation diffusion facilitator family transporter [Mesobacillus campisalis]KKK36708.1 cation diffusion facilitator family transporter [Mesobacillus campisalis]
MKDLLLLLRRGNKSALAAATVNSIISLIKGVAYLFTGNVAMFAETMHSLGDTANQFFVFVGSALSKKAPTRRFPNGFGRLVNLVLLGAVLIVGIMAYETILEGYRHLKHPVESSGFLIIVVVLGVSIILESIVLFKAMKETLHEVGIDAKGLDIIPKSIMNVNKAKPATKLVFLEDSVATGGGILALLAVLISHYTPYHHAEGIASIIIGILMFYVVGKTFLDNAAGVLGEADEYMQEKIARMVVEDPDIKDLPRISVLKEGDEFHVEVKVEVDPAITIAEADDIRDRLEENIRKERGVADVVVEFDEDDKVNTWESKQ